MRPDGTGVRVLTRVSGAQTGITSAVYSPDGRKIAYMQCTGDCGDPLLRGQGSIWVMNANGSGKHRVFNGRSGVQPATRLSWGAS
jgi:Tol biopolymer transport system component